MLNGDQINEFDINGFLIIDLDVKNQLIDQIVADVEPFYKKNPNQSGKYFHGIRVQDAWKYCDSVRQLAVNDKILGCLKQLFGRKPLPFQTLNFPIGTQQRIHSDTVHFNSMPAGYMAGVWVALEDVDRKNGALVYYPGSHKLPEYNMADVGVDAIRENYKNYEEFIAQKIEGSEFKPYYATLKKGQALLWHANLIHGGGEQFDKSLTRHSQVTHYFFEGCRYYTPLRSSKDSIFWRNPKWIPEGKCDWGMEIKYKIRKYKKLKRLG